jgi:hypothetical protein
MVLHSRIADCEPWSVSGATPVIHKFIAAYFGFNCGNRITSRMLSWQLMQH